MASRHPSYGDRSDVTERVVNLNRVAKVEQGGRRFSFSALIVVGDLNGRVGAGLGKAREVPEAIRKGVEIAKRNMISVPTVGTTIPHEVRFKWGAAKILMKPAAPGTGVISGGTMLAVQSLRSAQEVAELRGKQVEEIVGPKLAAAYRAAAARGSIQDVGGAGATTAPVGAPTPADTAAASRPPRDQRQGAATVVAATPAAPAVPATPAAPA